MIIPTRDSMFTLVDAKDLAQLLIAVLIIITPATVALWHQRIDARTKPDRDKIAKLEDEVRVLTLWRDMTAANINAIPQTLAVLERLEPAITTLSKVCGQLGERMARIEGPLK